MANRRMFSQRITGDEKFLEMPTSAQNLYFHLGIYADDDGFVNPQKIVRMIGANPDDLKVLLIKSFVIPFETGVIVITHWKENNYIQSDRYTPTIYQNEFKKLSIIQNVYKMDTQVRLGKGSNNEFDKSNSSLKGQKSNKLPLNVSSMSKFNRMGSYREDRASDSHEDVVDMETGEVAGVEVNKREGKNKIAIRLQHFFVDLCQKNFQKSPLVDGVGYIRVIAALKVLNEDRIKDLFDEWFSLGKPDEETIQITRALSNNQINSYIAKN